MFQKTISLLSSIYQSVEDVILRPWFNQEPIESFNSILFIKAFGLIKGEMIVHNSVPDENDKNIFSQIYFEDSLTEEEHLIFNRSFKFYFDIQDTRDIRFYLDMNALVQKDTLKLIDPNVLILKSGRSLPSTEEEFLPIEPIDEIITSGNLIFCIITIRRPLDELCESYDLICLEKKVLDSSIMYSFCFGVSLLRASWLLFKLSKYCPNMNFTTATVENPQLLSSFETIPKETKPDMSEFAEILETIETKSKIISKEKFEKLLCKIPQRSQVQNINLIYSTSVHGISLSTFYRQSQRSTKKGWLSPIYLLLIKDFHDIIFGAVLSDSPTPSNKFYGNGECFVFSFKNETLAVYPWSEKNDYFIMGTGTIFSIGSDNGKNAIWFDEKILNGRSQSCSTFNNPPLSQNEDFKCRILELWAFKSSFDD